MLPVERGGEGVQWVSGQQPGAEGAEDSATAQQRGGWSRDSRRSKQSPLGPHFTSVRTVVNVAPQRNINLVLHEQLLEDAKGCVPSAAILGV